MATYNQILEQDSIQGGIILILVGLLEIGLAYGNVIAVESYYGAILALAGVVIFSVETFRFSRKNNA